MESLAAVWQNMYHNFFSICALIPALFGAVLSILFLRLKNKSPATVIFGLILASMSLFYTGYFIAVIIYHPYAAFHRWLTLGSSMECFSLFILFFFYYPEERNIKLGKAIFFTVNGALILFFTAYIINSLTDAEIVFSFSSHYYDFAPSFYEKTAPVILLVLLCGILVSGICRSITLKKLRWATLSIALLAFVTFLIPVIFNILSRSGHVARGSYQISQDLSTLFGFFSITIIYINTTKDRTSLLTRVIVISFATILLMFQGICYFILNDQELSYNELKYRDSLIYLSNGTIPEGLRYHAARTPDGNIILDKKSSLKTDEAIFIFPSAASANKKNSVFSTGSSGENYVVYNVQDAAGTLHEFGYAYLNYRTFLHQSSRVLVFTLAAITIIIIFGFQLFFYNSITYPLINIQKGIESVRNGDVNIRLPILVEDEFGMISESFNTMVSRIDKADKSIADYTTNLGKMVEDRTEKLSRSIEDLKNAQAKLIEAEKLAFLGSLVAGVSHEINTPLGICITSSSFLLTETSRTIKHFSENKLTKTDLEQYLQNASDSTTMLLKNLYNANDMVGTFKKIAVDQSHEEIRTFNVCEYIQDIRSSLKHTLKRTSHHLNLNCPDDLSIKSYPGALYQIITNLVMNSIIHGFESMVEGTITITISRNENVIIEYSDNGCGMNKEQLHRMYDPFYTTKRGKGGSGLGMNIVYNIVTQKLKGTIAAESEPGKGVRFIISFPDSPVQS